jgi:hypothetical protein
MNNWKIVPNPPFADGLFSEQQTAAWEALKQQMPLGTRVTGSVYIQAPFGVFYDAGLGFPVLINVTDFGKPEGGMQFPNDYPPLGSSMSGEVWGFDENNRQIRVAKQFFIPPPYTEQFGRLPDFRVTYRLFTAEEGGRKMPAYQGIRWDFRYEDKSIHTGIWMIWPEFLGLDGEVLPPGQIPDLGQANMFCVNKDSHTFHRQHIQPGVRGYFVEGARRMGVCEVVEVLGLR